MEPRRKAEPSRFGPYRVIGTLDAGGRADDARRRIARDDRTGRTAVLMLPHETLADDPGYRVRFRSEGENSHRLTGGRAAPVIDVAGPGADLPWVAYACFLALPLPAALAACDRPLPEPTVRALGAVLAHALADWHAGGLVHAGISPRATLLMVLTRKYASGGTGTEDHAVVCYDSVRREGIWRAPLPAPYQGDGDATAALLGLDTEDGRKRWSAPGADAAVLLGADEGAANLATRSGGIRAVDLTSPRTARCGPSRRPWPHRPRRRPERRSPGAAW
ncbi:hypothetical protein [Streptomyces sp. 6N106]|uniref:hypothetical protein n=1 Tax=Streptomyces sp. 6N106 TaxID=3457418 RepID=UPI003FD3CB0A